MFDHKHHQTLIQQIKEILRKTIINYTDVIDTYRIDINKINIDVNRTKDLKFGDYASSVVLSLNLVLDESLRIANLIATNLPKKIFKKVTVVPPGFINMELNQECNARIIGQIIKEQNNFGQFRPQKLFYNIEFVSANPTGLLHVGHARNAAIGDSLCRIWQTYGIAVNREYYVNDGGNQIAKLALSVFIRYLQLFDKSVSLPEDGYHGEEIIDIAKVIKSKNNDKFINVNYDLTKTISDDEVNNFFSNFSKDYLLDIIKNDLKNFGVHFDIWFNESTIYDKKLIPLTLDLVKKHIYQKDGATWLKTTPYGDDKDRVLVKSDGTNTYFLPDIAYHNVKLSRGYDKIFNIWGADHKSYADRMAIAIELLGYQKQQFNVLIMQMVKLTQNGQELKMSKRSGTSLTMRDLIDKIGKDAARWYLVSQAITTHLDIDVDRAVAKSNNNPIYYVQYAHARINQLINKVSYKQPQNYNLLTTPHERELINQLHYFKHTIEMVSKNYEVNKMTLYLTNLAKTFHAFYANNKIIDPQKLELSTQRYFLAMAVKQIIANGLKLLGITPINQM